MVVACLRNRFQQKDSIQTIQTVEILLSKELREEDLCHKV